MSHFCGSNIENKVVNWMLCFMRSKQESFGGVMLVAYLEDLRPLQTQTWCVGREIKKTGLPWILLSLHAVTEPLHMAFPVCLFRLFPLQFTAPRGSILGDQKWWLPVSEGLDLESGATSLVSYSISQSCHRTHQHSTVGDLNFISWWEDSRRICGHL